MTTALAKPVAPKRPEQGQVYTFPELAELRLDDSPFLRFQLQLPSGMRVVAVIQTSHVTGEEELQVEGIKDTCWEYQHTTREWIPLFLYVGDQSGDEPQSILKYVDVFPWVEEPHFGVWATLKGFPRPMYFLDNEKYRERAEMAPLFFNDEERVRKDQEMKERGFNLRVDIQDEQEGGFKRDFSLYLKGEWDEGAVYRLLQDGLRNSWVANTPQFVQL